MKIMIIDDDALLRRTMGRMLIAEGHEVVTAADGTSGLTIFQREKPDIVVTDIVMPQPEGLEIILALRREDTPVKIIAISGQGGDMLETARMIGADDVIEKPFRAHELVSRIRAL